MTKSKDFADALRAAYDYEAGVDGKFSATEDILLNYIGELEQQIKDGPNLRAENRSLAERARRAERNEANLRDQVEDLQEKLSSVEVHPARRGFAERVSVRIARRGDEYEGCTGYIECFNSLRKEYLVEIPFHPENVFRYYKEEELFSNE